MKNRYILKIAYDGMKFNGWQKQKNAITVQEVLEKSLSLILKEDISIVGAGRTDTGVHATSQFAHFDTISTLKPSFLHKINGLLPYSISVLEIYQTHNNFHARFDALYRKYIYRIVTQKNPFEIERALFVSHKLNLEKMQEASQQLLSFEHFASFCKSNADNKTDICKVYLAELKINQPIIEFHIQANRFLRGMVRAIVGTLLEVGKEKISVQDFIEIVQSRDRKNAKMNVMPYGLYLVDVGYPKGAIQVLKNEK